MIGNAGRARSYALPVVSWTQIPVPLRRWAYRFASGLLLVYRLLRRPTFTGVKCVLTDGDLVLLVRHTYGQREWLLPGGSLKRDEPPLSAARREMREELGIDIADWTALGELTAYTERGRDRLHCFQAELRDAALTRARIRGLVPARRIAARPRTFCPADPRPRAPDARELSSARYSHSIVPGGLLVISSTTRPTGRISLIIRDAICSSRSYGSLAQSAVMASSLVTARITITLP
jgi:8-oxo-dGTP pyrophosphatase MutT (NUDIX family)